MGEQIADVVKILSKNPKLKDNEEYMDMYISKIAQNDVAHMVKLADRLDNIRDWEGLKNKKAYIKETESWFVELAKGTVFESDINQALQELKAAVKVTEKEEPSI